MPSHQCPPVPNNFPPSPLSSISTPSSLSLSSLSTLSPPPTRLFFPHNLSPREEEVFGSPQRRHAAGSGPVPDLASPFSGASGDGTLLRSPTPRTRSTPRHAATASPTLVHSPQLHGPSAYSGTRTRRFGENVPGTVVYETTTTVTRTKTTKTRRYELPPSTPNQAEGLPRPEDLHRRANAGSPVSTRLYGTTSISPSPPRPARSASHLSPPFTPSTFTPLALLQPTPLALAATPPNSPEVAPAPNTPLAAVRTHSTPAALSAHSTLTAATRHPAQGTLPTPSTPAAANHPRLISWVNQVEKFAPLYEDETDAEETAPPRVFMIPNPQAMKPPALTEVGKSDYYVVTCGQEVGVYGSFADVLARVEHVPCSAYVTRKTWRGAKAAYTKAIQNRTIRVLPVTGGVFDKS